MSIAVFLSPNKPLKNEILLWKELVNANFNDSPYNNHPPHSTIVKIEAEDEIGVIDILKSPRTRFKPFEIEINKKNVFWNDKMTGGHTLHFSIKKNIDILSFQSLIANNMKKFKMNIPPPKYIKNDPTMNRSFTKYGFPFVGSHWLPHFTVASIIVDMENSFIKKFLFNVDVEKFMVNKFSIWHIDGEKHTKIETVSLI